MEIGLMGLVNCLVTNFVCKMHWAFSCYGWISERFPNVNSSTDVGRMYIQFRKIEVHSISAKELVMISSFVHAVC